METQTVKLVQFVKRTTTLEVPITETKEEAIELALKMHKETNEEDLDIDENFMFDDEFEFE